MSRPGGVGMNEWIVEIPCILLAPALEYLEDKNFMDENTKVEPSYLTFFFLASFLLG